MIRPPKQTASLFIVACLSQKGIRPFWYVFGNGRRASIHSRHLRWLRIFGPDQNEGCAVNEKDPGNDHRITKKMGKTRKKDHALTPEDAR